MCRFMIYKGAKSMLMADLLTHPTRSIITQSYACRERMQNNPLNGDGFGVLILLCCCRCCLTSTECSFSRLVGTQIAQRKLFRKRRIPVFLVSSHQSLRPGRLLAHSLSLTPSHSLSLPYSTNTHILSCRNNVNLKRLATKVRSPLIFAHVRAAIPGMLVSEANCHPFQYGRYLWMHNGESDALANRSTRVIVIQEW